jgi:arylsulfatase A-like enzyme
VPEYDDPKIRAAIMARGAKDLTQQGGKNKGPAWEIADCRDEELPDGYIATKAIEALRARARAESGAGEGKPFFLAVGFIKPHLPFVAPRRFFDLYPLDKVPLSPAPQAPLGAPSFATTNFGELRAYVGMPKGERPVSERQARELVRGYYAAASFADAQVGKVLAELERLGLEDRTIIVLLGDHGWHLGDEGMWTKHTNFEIATRAPLLVSVPGMQHAGEKTAALVEFVDVYPTLCELAGLAQPAGLEGTSLAPLLADPARAWKSAAFSQFPRGKNIMGYTMRTDRYRYTQWQKRGDGDQPEVVARELYDEQADPHETKNLASDPAQAGTVKALSAKLQAGCRGALP